jgi:nucleoside-diphosphate-sugar epimerase
MKTILVLGGGGYVGCNLVRKLLKKNYQVIVYDLFLYKKDVFVDLLDNGNLKIIKGDIRDLNKLETFLENIDIIIHLACISNDPSYELNPNLGKDINFDCFPKLINKVKKYNIKQFIYASSSSVYGVKEESSVTEDLKAEPITDYSKFKLECEGILLNESEKFNKTIIRPATVCGYSERQRLDVIVNILTNHAFFNKKIIIHGGDQLRPNIHIDDMSDSYLKVIDNSDASNNEIFNVGDENHSVNELAEMVNLSCPDAQLIREEVLDQRSYKISSEKIFKKIGFKTKKTISDAINDLVNAFKSKRLINTFNDEGYYNIKVIKKNLNSLIND